MSNDEIIKAESLTKTYMTGEVPTHALNNVSLTIRKGEFTAIAGPSGSGKTTFLNIASGLDTPSGGKMFLAGRELGAISGTALSDFRRDHIGLIFQSYNLIPVLTVSENVEYIMLLQRLSPEIRHTRVKNILEEVGLGGKQDRYPHQLSGGQQQRVAIARAMASEPDIIMADEPTANLDSETGSELLDMMKELNTNRGMTFVFSTHDAMIMQKSKRLIMLKDGKIASDVVKN